MTMKRIILASALAVAFLIVGAPSCQPAEPAMTITGSLATAGGQDPAGFVVCGHIYQIKGVVTPANATPRVALQQKSGGKWADAKLYADADAYYATNPTLRTSTVNSSTGEYTITFLVHWYESTRSLRVRSNGSSAFTPTVYVKTSGYDGVCS